MRVCIDSLLSHLITVWKWMRCKCNARSQLSTCCSITADQSVAHSSITVVASPSHVAQADITAAIPCRSSLSTATLALESTAL